MAKFVADGDTVSGQVTSRVGQLVAEIRAVVGFAVVGLNVSKTFVAKFQMVDAFVNPI